MGPTRLLTQMNEKDENSLEIKHVEIVDPGADEADEAIWTNHGWTPPSDLDAVKELEKMEKSAAEKNMEEKMRAKGKITARDLEWQHRFQMKKKTNGFEGLARILQISFG